MAKGYAPNMLDYRNQASDLLKGQMDIQKSKMDIMSKEPTGYEAEQELLANTRNVVGSGARGKRGSELVIDGVLNGLQYGMRSKEVAGKKDQYSKMRNVLGYFEQVGQELQKQNQQNMQDEEERLQMEPTALTAIDLTYSGMPYEQTDAALRKLFETAKVNNSFVTEDYVGYIPNSSLILMRDENGEVFPADMRAMLRREDVESVQNNYNQRIGNDARMMGARASMMNAETNAAYRPQELAMQQKRTDIAEQNANTRFEQLGLKSSKELMPRLQASETTIHLADSLIKDAQKNPDLFSSALSAWVNTKGDAGAFNLAVQKMIGGKDRDAAQRITKNVRQLMLADAKSLGGQNNQTLDSWIQEAYPNIQYSQQNFIDIIEDVKRKAQFYRNIYRDTLNTPSGQHLGQSFDKRAAEFRGEKVPITLYDPDSKTTETKYVDNYEEALQKAQQAGLEARQ